MVNYGQCAYHVSKVDQKEIHRTKMHQFITSHQLVVAITKQLLSAQNVSAITPDGILLLNRTLGHAEIVIPEESLAYRQSILVPQFQI